MDSRPLNEEERALLDKLLSNEFPGREALRTQLKRATVRRIEADGTPIMLFSVPPDAPRAEVGRRVPLEAEGVATDADGGTIHLLIHVVDGYLNELELYREDGGRVQVMPGANAVRFAYEDTA